MSDDWFDEANKLRNELLHIQDLCWRRQLTLWLRDEDEPLSYSYCYAFRSGVPEFLHVVRPGVGVLGMYRTSDIRQLTETRVPRRPDDTGGPRSADYDFLITLFLLDRPEPLSFQPAHASFRHGDEGGESLIIDQPKEVRSVFSLRIVRRFTKEVIGIRPPAPPPPIKGWRRRYCWHQDVRISLNSGRELELSDVYVVCGLDALTIWRHRSRRKHDDRLGDYAYPDVEMLLSKPVSHRSSQ